MRRFQAVSLFIALSTGACAYAAASAPATGPAPATTPAATAPAGTIPPADYSTPQTALRTYIYARHSQVPAAIREAIESPADQKLDVEAAIQAIIAADDLQKAAAAKFGAEGVKVFNPDSAGKLAAQLKSLDDTQFEIKDDSATAKTPSGGTAPSNNLTGITRLVKTGAGWKVDGSSLLAPPGEPALTPAARVAALKKANEIAKKVIADINAGKYPAANDAYRDYWLRLAEAARSASAPATTSSTSTVPETMPLK